GILPTPAIGGVGIIPDIEKTADIGLKQDGSLLIAIGREQGHLGQSLYQAHATGHQEGAPPPVDLAEEIKAGTLVRALIREQAVRSVHDVSDGGLLVAIAEMALAGNRGVHLYPYEGRLPAHAIWFGEDQGRYVVEVDPETASRTVERAKLLALPVRIVARTGGDTIVLPGEGQLSLVALREAHEAWFPELMQDPAPSTAPPQSPA
ncbi:MAG: AIR synthase-related protein, partial [Pseudomonadota bacterium]